MTEYSPDASPNIRRGISDASPKVRQYIACEFSRGTTRSIPALIATRTRFFYRQYIARYFGPRGTVVFAVKWFEANGRGLFQS